MPIELTGITWNHTRGFLPMVATAQRFQELYPDVTITWNKRSLQAFADESLASLTEKYDLVILDHPWAGFLAESEATLPVDASLDLGDYAQNSVGASHPSYAAGGHQWALAVDAATPVSSWRPDLLEKHALSVPTTWGELLALADRGFVALPAIPIDTLMNFYMLCIGLGEEPFQEDERVVSDRVGEQAIAMLADLISRCDPARVGRNPIQTYEAMTRGDDIVYCPFAYGYVNYTRPEYAGRVLRFGGLVCLDNQRLRSTLGGTGLAVSRHCQHPDTAMSYLRFVASAEVQGGIYLTSGGQPAHRRVWEDPAANAWTSDFFTNTLPTLDNAFVRPTHEGAVPFQDAAGPVLHDHIVNRRSATDCLTKMNRLYRESTGSHGRR
jgi:multiple sugar transport system substrate-binding protein